VVRTVIYQKLPFSPRDMGNFRGYSTRVNDHSATNADDNNKIHF